MTDSRQMASTNLGFMSQNPSLQQPAEMSVDNDDQQAWDGYGQRLKQNSECSSTQSDALSTASHNDIPGGDLGHGELQRALGFAACRRMLGRHVPPRDFPHPQPNDPSHARSPVYLQQANPLLFSRELLRPGPQLPRPPVEEATYRYPKETGNPYPSYISSSVLSNPETNNNEVSSTQAAGPYPTPHMRAPNTMKAADPTSAAAAVADEEFEVAAPAGGPHQSSSTSDSTDPPIAVHSGIGNINSEKSYEIYEQYEEREDSTTSVCEEHQVEQRNALEDNNRVSIDFGEVGSMVDTFWPKPGDVLILATQRSGCPWPAFDGHLEIYVDEGYFTKSSVALQWNYEFEDGDIVLRFGEFDRHWRWQANEQIHVFLRENGAFFLVARQHAQELHPLDFRFVDPHQRPVHTTQYLFQPRVGDLVLRKGTDDSYIWQTNWWHPGGDSHLLLKHMKQPFYPQCPHPQYKWTANWYKRGFRFQHQDILLRVGYESAEDNMHCYCVCEIYFHGVDGFWSFQGRDDYSFGPPGHIY